MTADLLTTLGIEPARGRGFRASEDRPGSPLVVIVGHAFSDRYFGMDTDALGQTLTLDGNRYTVVGVLPRGVRSLAGTEAELWPIFQLPSPTRRGPFFLRGIGRIRPGHSLDEARRDLAHVSEVIFPLWADGFQDREAHLTPVPLRDVVVGDVGGALMLLLGAAGFVLLIAIANVANLTLARATGREREMALRTSLGATRSRLARQLMVESVMLAIIGGALGAMVALLALDTLLNLSPRLPRLDEVRLDGRALGFTAVITTASGIVFGMAPIFHAWSPNLAVALHAGGRAGSEGRRWHAVRGVLVTAEFALALPLLVGAALLLTSLVQMQRVDPGFDPGNLFTARVSLPDAHYPDGGAVLQFWEQALPKITELPGIESAALTSSLPPDNPGITNNFDLLDRPVPPGSRHVDHLHRGLHRLTGIDRSRPQVDGGGGCLGSERQPAREPRRLYSGQRPHPFDQTIVELTSHGNRSDPIFGRRQLERHEPAGVEAERYPAQIVHGRREQRRRNEQQRRERGLQGHEATLHLLSGVGLHVQTGALRAQEVRDRDTVQHQPR